MNVQLPDKGMLVRTSCDHHAFSVLIPAQRGKDIMRHAATLSSAHALPEIELAALIQDHVAGLATEIEAATAGSFPRFPDNEESVKDVIAVLTLTLLSTRADLARLLAEVFKEDRGTVAVHLSEESVNVVITDPDATWDARYTLGSSDTPVVAMN